MKSNTLKAAWIPVNQENDLPDSFRPNWLSELYVFIKTILSLKI